MAVFSNTDHNTPSTMRPVKVRFAIVGLLSLMAFLLLPILDSEYSFRPLAILFLAALVNNLIFFVWTIWGRWFRYRVYFLTCADILLITMGVHYIGGIESTLSWVYAVALITISLLHGMRVGVFAAVVSSLMYAALLFGEFHGIIPHIGLNRLNPLYLHQDTHYLHIRVISDTLLFLISATVAGILSDRLLQSNARLEETVADRTGELTGANEKLRQQIFEHARAEDALRSSEDRYRTLLDNSLTGVYVRQEEKMVFVNQRLVEMVGYSKEELLGSPFLNLIHPEDREFARDRAKRRMAGEKSEGNTQFRCATKNGEILWLETFGTLIEYEGKPAILGNLIDITDRKRAENALEESEYRYRTLVEEASDIIVTIDLDTGAVSSANNFAETILGYKREDVLYKMHFQDLIHPDEHERALGNIQERVTENKRYPNSPFRLKKADGSYIDTEINGAIIYGTEGRPNSYLAVARDVTERKRAEDALEKSFSLLRATLDSTADGILVVDGDGKITSYNQKFVELWRIPEHVMVARDDDEALSFVLDQLKDPEVFVQKVQELYAHPDAESHDVLEFKDGRVFERYSQSQQVGGKSVGRVWSFRDITGQKKLEQQIMQAQKMESIGTLAGGIAHDFNNLLGGILGYASLMKSKIAKDHEAFKYANTIETSATRAAELTAQLLAFARGGKYEVTVLNLNAIINETLEIIGRTIDKSIEIETDLQDGLVTVEADAVQIEQVVMNLCVNARDAMPNGGKLIIETGIERLTEEYVHSHMGAKEGLYVRMSLTDTGVGMTKETVERIFEPFFTTKEKGKGTGLGLSMVYGVVKNHGGYVHVYSEPGEGSVFKVYLPANGKAEIKELPRNESPANGTELVLVVDDEEPIRFLAKDTLESFGYSVLLAENGEQAVEIYKTRRNEIDLVVLDMIMPKMGGRETFLKLKAMNPDIKALLSSGYSQNEKAEEILNSGVSGFVQKPYQIDTLLSKVRSALDADS